MGDTSDGERTPDFCRRVVAPNKRKMEAELDVVVRDITEKDNKLRSIQVKLENAGISSELQKIRSEKEVKIDKRRGIDRQLSALNTEISKKKDAAAKLKSNLQYLKEERIDEAIRRLNRDLQMRNFRLNQEKKVVNEIDTLNRSKRVLREYQDLCDELNQMRERQKKMREDLDDCYKTVSSHKNRETDLRSRRDKFRREIEAVKAELEVLHQKKRDIVSDFRRREKEFKEHKETREHKVKKVKEEEVKVEPKESEDNHIHAQAHVHVHIEPSIEPFIEEKQLCTTLVTYLHRYITPTDQAQSAGSPGPTDPKQIEQDGMYVLPRKRIDDDETKYNAVIRRTSSKNKRRDRQKKIQVSHTPEIFAQFAKLNLNAPSNTNEVATSIEQLQGKRLYYNTAVPDTKPTPGAQVGPQGDATSAIKSSDVVVASQKPTNDNTDFMSSSKETSDLNSSEVQTKQLDNINTYTPVKTVKTATVSPAKIEEEKESQGSDDVFYDSDDDVFCDDDQNIPQTPLEKRRNFCLVSSRSDIKPLMANADFLADAIRGCGQNGFVMPSPLSMCSTMTNVIEHPVVSNNEPIIKQDEANVSSNQDKDDTSNQVELNVETAVSNKDIADTVTDKSEAHVTTKDNDIVSDTLDANKVDINSANPVLPQINGASNHTDMSNGHLSDSDVDSSCRDLLCEIKNLTNGTGSLNNGAALDVDIEPSTDSSDITDSYESTDQHLLTAKTKTIGLDEMEIIRPVICKKGRSSSVNLDHSLEDSLKAEDELES